MTIKDASDEIKRRWREVLPAMGLERAKQKVNGEISYICPLCQHGKSADGLTFNPKSRTGTGLICFNAGCEFSGSDIDLYAQMHGRDLSDAAQFVETVKDMGGLIGIDVDDQPVDLPPKPKKDDQPSVKEAPSSTESGKDVAESITDPPPRKPNTPRKYEKRMLYAADDLYSDAGKDVLDYLHGRGLTDETLKKYRVGYRPSGEYFVKAHKELPAITFPHDGLCAYYSARSLEGKYFNKPKEDEAGSQPLYNGYALKEDKPVFIVEGQLDALSIMQCKGHAAALAGGAWESVLMSRVSKYPPKMPLILALDNDDAGQKAQAGMAAALEAQGIPFIEAQFSLDKYPGEKKKDANDLLQADAKQLEKDIARIEAEVQRALKPDNILDYVQQAMQGEIERLQKDAQRKTGFSNLDAILGSLYAGLIILGGLPSMGKTSFLYQLCDQLAQAGNHVLFFSLEMSRLELVSKSISRYTRYGGEKRAVSSLQIRLGAKGEWISTATQNYLRDVGDRLSVIEGNFDCDVERIRTYAQQYVEFNKAVPIIAIDYLQILPPLTDARGRKATDPRIIVNDNVTALKRLSRELQTPVIVISSMNRANYTSPLSFESFRESGSVEYSADIVAGLQLSCMNDPLFAQDKGLIEKRQKIQEAKGKMPREIELCILKNRYGRSNANCQFYYYPQYDFFSPTEATFDDAPEGAQIFDDCDQIPLF